MGAKTDNKIDILREFVDVLGVDCVIRGDIGTDEHYAYCLIIKAIDMLKTNDFKNIKQFTDFWLQNQNDFDFAPIVEGQIKLGLSVKNNVQKPCKERGGQIKNVD